MSLNTLRDFDGHICDVGSIEVPSGWLGEYRIDRDGATVQRGKTQKINSTSSLAEDDAFEAAKEWVLLSQGTTVAINAGIYEMGSRQIAHQARDWKRKNQHGTAEFLDAFPYAKLIASPGRK